MTVPATLIELVRYRSATQPLSCAYTFLADGEEEEASISYRDLEIRAQAIAAWLQKYTRPRDRVLLLFPPGLDYIAAFFGCLFADVIAVPAYPPKKRVGPGEGRIEAIIRDASPSLVLAAPEVVSKYQEKSVSTANAAQILCHAVEDIPLALAGEWHEPSVSSETTAFLQYTSGSTALPKGVMVSHANLIHNQRMIQDACQHDSASTFVGWLPLYHDMGLIGNVLQPLFIGAPSILMSPSSFVQKPIRWLAAISRYRAHTSGGPNFAYELCNRKINPEECEGLDLSSWAVAFNGAEPVRQDTLDKFKARFRRFGFRKTAFVPCYGLAEASLIVSCKRRSAPQVAMQLAAKALEQNRVEECASKLGDTREVVSCGASVIDTEIIIVNPDTRKVCRPEGVGEIWIRGLGVAAGYWNQPDKSEEVFHARTADDGAHTFLRTGDLGFLHDDELFITGRLKDVILVRGQNHYAEDIEWSVQQCNPDISVAAAFSDDSEGAEKLVIAIELERSSHRDERSISSDIRQVVAERHELEVGAILFVKRGRIPRTSSGKIQRKLCRKWYLDKNLEVELSEPSRAVSVLHNSGNAPGRPLVEFEVAELSASHRS